MTIIHPGLPLAVLRSVMKLRARSLVAIFALSLLSPPAFAGSGAKPGVTVVGQSKSIGAYLRGLVQKRYSGGSRTGHLQLEAQEHEEVTPVVALTPGKSAKITTGRPTRASKTAQKTKQSDALRPDTFGERAADKVARYAGSWKFISSFSLGMGVWMAYNTFGGHPFDAPPFIGLNLMLSTVAALQAPFILMSANRQAQKDRLRTEADFAINVKAEHEVSQLNDKIESLNDSVRILTDALAKQNGIKPGKATKSKN